MPPQPQQQQVRRPAKANDGLQEADSSDAATTSTPTAFNMPPDIVSYLTQTCDVILSRHRQLFRPYWGLASML